MFLKSPFVRRRPREQFHQDCFVERVKHPVSVMVWSVISAKAMVCLYIVEGTMNQDQFKRVLVSRLLPQLKVWFPGDEVCIFGHVSAPCRIARGVTTFLVEKNVTVLPWPGNSQNMNPIDNIWELTKRAIDKARDHNLAPVDRNTNQRVALQQRPPTKCKKPL